MDEQIKLDLYQRLSRMEAIMKEQCKKIDSLHTMLLSNQQLYIAETKSHVAEMHACREQASVKLGAVYSTIDEIAQSTKQMIDEENKRTNDLMLKVVFAIMGSVVITIALAVFSQKFF